ncbi:acyl-CoA/acyl-ACP dehydrogenase [Spongiactinospora rosea]|uniref:acyl-CoA/acyl-ACP dehydrogenase n=1 Tax=Spongiactinospora rosea TaxID=2248750 RepID=UPI0018F66AEF|nr:acyl-CoA/acyl-ACP dehydrogenase [Spongiactinospora rosea]
MAPASGSSATDGPGIGLFRDSGGPGLLVLAAYQGREATALDALRVQRALGSRAPSLAVATTLHHFSMATLAAVIADEGMKSMILESLAATNDLVTFGFAEERPGAGVLSPSMTATEGPDGVGVSGVTHPHGLAGSMELLIAGVMLSPSDGSGEQPAVALVPAESEGLSVSETGAGSEQVTLDDVLVAPELLVRDSGLGGRLDALLAASFAWYQLLMTGSRLGAASALVERVLLDNRVPEAERVRLLVETEGAMSAAEGVARRIDDGGTDEPALAHSLYVRYCVEDALSRLVPRAVELLGSTASDEVGHLAACANGLASQPPVRSQMTGPLAAYLEGGSLTIA